MTSSQLRNSFLEFFKSKGHTIVKSASLIPENDPTLLFTNAGMNQFKDVFLGTGKRNYTRCADSQKCIRVSGKHNDLEEVGYDTYHHTFFEMLGNWSFGDYYKKEAIEYAWELLTEVWKLPKERLWATVHITDDEAEKMWPQYTDMPASKVLKFDKENFWEMGDTGPCGPCSEIHIDLGEDSCRLKGQEHYCGINGKCGRYIELWNLVFIQYNREPDGKLTELPAKHIDTGMGFERALAVVQGKSSNYDTDVFMSIINAIEDLTGIKYNSSFLGDKEKSQAPFRAIADHIRTMTFAITDGVIPSNEGRGYVIRRIMRRAARFGRILEMHEPFIYKLVSTVVDVMGSAYPEIKERANYTTQIIKAEEENFSNTIDRGMEIFNKIVNELKNKNESVIPGESAFKLYDTFGFPIDLTEQMAREINFTVDSKAFNDEMEKQKDRSRCASKFKEAEICSDWICLTDNSTPHSEFVGYTDFKIETSITKYRTVKVGSQQLAVISNQLSVISNETESIRNLQSPINNLIELVLSKTPFYAESGGQIGDTGRIYNDDFEIQVIDTQKINIPDTHDYTIVHIGILKHGEINNKPVIAEIDVERRKRIMRNHTATHLLHWALRKVIGEHAKQSGSLVADDRFRFDYSHFEPLRKEDIDRIEELINSKIRESATVNTFYSDIESAKKLGAMMLFGEKYGDTVRVVKTGDYSIELCGGTHVSNTGEIGLFRLLSDSSISAGIRRIEGITGDIAYQHDKKDSETLKEIAEILKCKVSDVIDRVRAIVDSNKSLTNEIEKLKRKSAESLIGELCNSVQNINDIKVVSMKVNEIPPDILRDTADAVKSKLGSGVVILGTVNNDKVFWVVTVSDDLIKNKKLRAGDIIKELAKITGGGGGGRADFAQAGGKDPSKIDEAIKKSFEIIKGML